MERRQRRLVETQLVRRERRPNVDRLRWDEQLQQLAAVGQLQPLDMVLQEGSRKWTAARENNNLFPAAPNQAAPPILKPQLPVASAALPVIKRSRKPLYLAVGFAAASLLVLCLACGYWALKSTFPVQRPMSQDGTSPAVAVAQSQPPSRQRVPDAIPARDKERQSPLDTLTNTADSAPTMTPADGKKPPPPEQHEQPNLPAEGTKIQVSADDSWVGKRVMAKKASTTIGHTDDLGRGVEDGTLEDVVYTVEEERGAWIKMHARGVFGWFAASDAVLRRHTLVTYIN